MKIKLKNIQSIKECLYEFPDVGVVQITGPNSNGKSILFKALGAITSLEMMDQDKRDTLINDDSDSGTISIEYRNQILVVQLNRNRNSCMVVLKRADNTVIQRTFRDGGIQELLHEFGFRTYANNSVCTQLYETFGLMPFVNTSLKLNGEIVEDITEDAIAKEFLEKYKTITHPAARAQLKALNEKVDNLERMKQTLVTYDYPKYQAYYAKLQAIFDVSKNFADIDLTYLERPDEANILEPIPESIQPIALVPDVNILDLCVPELVLLQQCDGLDLAGLIKDECISDIKSITSIVSGVCPTCGQLLVGGCSHE